MSNTKLFVGHLPDDATHGDLEQLMKHLNWDENQIRRCEINLVHDRATDKFKGFAYVDVKSEECAEQFLKLDGADFGDKRLRVDRATPKESHRGGGRGGSRGGFRGGRGGGEFQRGGDEAGRGGGGSRGGFRDRRGSHGGRGGYTERRGSQSDEKHDLDKNGNQEEPATPLPERPRLKLTPLTTDPAVLEAKKKREAEEEAARRAKLFQA